MPAATGYTLPGTKIEEVTQPTTVNISTSQRLPVFIGTASAYMLVQFEEVVRSSTGLTPHADSLAYTSAGIYQILEVGSQRGLADYVVTTDYSLHSNKILWTSTGARPVNGATYFVSYKYDRPYSATYLTDPTKNDYRYKEFTTIDDVIADLGDIVPENPLVMIANLALKYYNVPKIATVQVYAEDNISDYTDALSLIMYRDVQTVVPLSTNATIRNLVINHIKERSLPDNGRWRMAWFGTPIATPIGDESDTDSIRGIAASIKNERCIVVNATRATYFYNDPDTKEQLSTVVNGQFIAAAIAAYRDAFVYPATGMLGKTVPGLELFSDDFDDYYNDYWLKQAGGSGVYIVDSVNGAIRIRDDITTDNTTIERNNPNIITAKDYVAKDVAAQLTNTFVGQLIMDPSAYINTFLAYLAALFAAYKRSSVIAAVGTLKAQIDPTKRTRVLFSYSYLSVYENKEIYGTYALEV